jgi:hypothetical protein
LDIKKLRSIFALSITTTMKNLIHYRFTVENLFFKFTKKQIDLDELITLLCMLEGEHRLVENLPNDDKGLWFKFSKDDTLATTISDIERTFTHDTRNNQEFLLERMESVCGLNPDNELRIFYS